MGFKLTELDAFRNAQFDGAKAIANLGEGGKVVQNNSYKGAIAAMFRGKKTEAANNAVRTELLRSLGNAFGLEGVGRNEKVKANPDNVGEWKDVADQVKRDLVGVIRPIDVPVVVTSRDESGEELVEHKFKPLIGETGKPVVRAITEADIDAIGPAVLDTILYG